MSARSLSKHFCLYSAEVAEFMLVPMPKPSSRIMAMASAKATAGASCRWHTPIFMKSTMERMSRHVASVRFCLSVVF